MSGSNPLKDLLANQVEPTELDRHFDKKEPKNEIAQEVIGPQLVVADPTEEDDAPIGLTHRQPSFASLHGQMILKDGEAIPTLPQVTEEIPEEKEEETEPVHEEKPITVPIGLSHRQSSYASLINQLPKGLDAKVPQVQAIEEATIEEEPEGDEGDYDTMEEEEDDSEEDFDPQVVIVKQLKNKNKKTWHKIGYQPPKDLISLVRTKSQQSYNALSQNSNTSTPMASYAQKDIPTIQDIEEEQVKENGKKNPTPTRRARCGSFGMKLGEASSSMAMMESIIKENPNTIEMNIQQIDEEGEEEDTTEEDNSEAEEEYNAAGEEEEEAADSDNDDDDSNDDNSDKNDTDDDYDFEEEEDFSDDSDDDTPFGRLADIVKEGRSSPVVFALNNGYVKDDDDVPSVRRALEKYRRVCTRRLWVPEGEFLDKILSRMPGTATTTHGHKSGRSLKEQAAEVLANRDREIQELSDRMESALALTDSDYVVAAAELDREWQSDAALAPFARPSERLTELRRRIATASAAGRKRETEKLQKEARALADAETRAANKAIRDAYYAADRALKDRFVKRRVEVTRRFEGYISTAEQRAQEEIARLKKQSARAALKKK